MMTQHEARQRCSLNNVRLRRHVAGDWVVSLIEWKDEERAYFTDDLEDAVLTGSAMRQAALKHTA